MAKYEYNRIAGFGGYNVSFFLQSGRSSNTGDLIYIFDDFFFLLHI